MTLDPALAAIVAFLLYFSVSCLAVIYHRKSTVRTAYLVFFFTLLTLPGLFGRWAWPFFSWHLYSYAAPTDFAFYELRVADVAGQEIKYDARAAAPTLQTPVVRFARRLPELPPHRAATFASFLLARAEAYRQRLFSGSPSLVELLKFPRHQLGFYWTRERIENFSRFEELRLYHRHVTVSHDGAEVLHQSEKLIAVYR